MDLFTYQFNWDNRRHFLYQLPHRAQVQFALFCANQIKHLIRDKKSLEALKITKSFLDEKATKEECRLATSAASAAAYDASAASAAAYDASAAYAAAYAAASAAASAASAAAYDASAASAAAYDASAELKQEQLFFLRELIIENLSEEERNNWLLVTCF